ncbi:hypothetical protein [Microbispora bryophytorum]|uniref:hypothetical protein n=1 Tax=Microbispora bryophytorum TaxID=1460882 RepID=UPI0033DF7A2D
MHQSSAADSLGTIPGWRIFKSDANRMWATRDVPFSAAAEKARAFRTVDADDMDELRRVIDIQEQIASEADKADK